MLPVNSSSAPSILVSSAVLVYALRTDDYEAITLVSVSIATCQKHPLDKVQIFSTLQSFLDKDAVLLVLAMQFE